MTSPIHSSHFTLFVCTYTYICSYIQFGNPRIQSILINDCPNGQSLVHTYIKRRLIKSFFRTAHATEKGVNFKKSTLFSVFFTKGHALLKENNIKLTGTAFVVVTKTKYPKIKSVYINWSVSVKFLCRRQVQV